jgi:hypothetical protein
VVAGYSPVVWCVVMNLAFTGLLVSWIMKFADTIVKVYSTSMAMLVTMLISAWLFNVQPNLQVRHSHETERVDRVGSHGRWKRPCLQTAHVPI